MKRTWDPWKSKENLRKHKIDFATAAFVFHDCLLARRLDPYPDEERWQTIGMVASQVVIVVHTLPDEHQVWPEPVGRIISARKATPWERRAYEEGNG